MHPPVRGSHSIRVLCRAKRLYQLLLVIIREDRRLNRDGELIDLAGEGERHL